MTRACTIGPATKECQYKCVTSPFPTSSPTSKSSKLVALYREYRGTSAFHDLLVQKIILRNMAAINRKLGQENDPNFLAYAVEYVINCGDKQ